MSMATVARHDRINEWARKALLAMRQRQIPPTPENYAVWYHVAADADPALTRMIRVLDDQCAGFDEFRNWEIYQCFFGKEREREQLRTIGDRVETHLGAIGELVGQILDGTRAYGDTLDDVVDSIPATTGLGDLNRALDTLRHDTRRILDRTDGWGLAASAQADEVSKLKNDLDAARTEAETDGLTQIGNRKRFDRRLRELAAAACEHDTPLSTILFDVDHFKTFNDTYGHNVGDRVLKLVASRVAATVPPPGEVFRYGGEEFAVILPRLGLGHAVDIAETVRKTVASIRIARKSDSAPLRQVTVSLGVSQYEYGEPLSRLVDRADAALYGAKNSGRNCTSIKRPKARAA